MGCAPSKKKTASESDPTQDPTAAPQAGSLQVAPMQSPNNATPPLSPVLPSAVSLPEANNLRARAKDLFAQLKATTTSTTYSMIRNKYDSLENRKEAQLCLPGCAIGGDLGAEILAIGITFSTRLVTVHLGFCEIGPRGARAIGTALKRHPSLRSLALGGSTEPHDDAAVSDFVMSRSIAESLQDKRFEKTKNRIGDEGAVVIAGGLKENEVLESLDLSENDIGDRGVLELVRATETRKLVLKQLCLAKNEKISDKTGKRYGFRTEVAVQWE